MNNSEDWLETKSLLESIKSDIKRARFLLSALTITSRKQC